MMMIIMAICSPNFLQGARVSPKAPHHLFTGKKMMQWQVWTGCIYNVHANNVEQDDNDDDDDDVDDLDDDDKNKDDNDDTSLDRVYANKVVEDTPGLGISGSNPSLAP